MKTREQIIEILRELSTKQGFTYKQAYSMTEKQVEQIADRLSEQEVSEERIQELNPYGVMEAPGLRDIWQNGFKAAIKELNK